MIMKRISGFRFPAFVLTLAAVAAMTAMTDATSSQQPKPRQARGSGVCLEAPAHLKPRLHRGIGQIELF